MKAGPFKKISTVKFNVIYIFLLKDSFLNKYKYIHVCFKININIYMYVYYKRYSYP